MWKPVQEPARLNLFQVLHDIAITATRRRYDNVFVEWPRYEYNDYEQVHHSADSAHGLRAMSCER